MIGRLFPPGSKARAAAIAVVAFAGLLLLTQVMLPGNRGSGTPAAKLFEGLVFGLLNALIAAGIILIYRTTRIINFAQGAMGAAGGVFTFNLGVLLNWPYWLSFPAGVIVAAALGAAVELGVIRRFFDAPRLVLTVLTIGLIGALGFATGFVASLPIFGDATDIDFGDLANRQVPTPFPNFSFTIAGYPLEFGFPHIFGLIMSVLALAGLGYFFRFTKAGVAVKAAAENSERAMLLGINVKSLSTLVWTIAGVLSGVGVIISTTIIGFTGGGDFSPAVLLTALAAAVIAKMRSLPVAIAAAIGITVAREAVRLSYPTLDRVVDIGVFFLILIALVFQKTKLTRSEAQEASSWKATEEVRPTPKELLAVRGVKVWRIVLIAVGVLSVLMFPWVTPPGTVNRGGFVAITAIVVVSLVVLTGWAGQVSLGQMGFVAVGAVVGGAITSKADLSFWLALPVGGALTAAFAVIIGLPALRIKGLFLGVTTFAFAFAIQASLFEEKYFGWLLPDRIDRPELFLLDFEDERSMYYLAVFALLLTVLVVTTLRKSRTGRVLIALRDNEPNVQSFGVNAIRTRLAAFALSGFLCGFAGVLLAHHQRGVTEQAFGVEESIAVFLYAVVGGIGSVSGALLGAAFYAAAQILGGNQIATFFFGPLGVLFILYGAPGGLASMAFGLRDSILRIVAQRRRLVVPSLFADVDPEVVAQQVAPLAETLPNTGLSALPFGQRYRIDSSLHGVRRKSVVKASPVREASLIGAVAEALEPEDGSTPAAMEGA